MVTQSTAEAEYIALCDLVKELFWYIELLEELGFPQGSIVVHCDNQSSIAIVKNPGHHDRTKHIRTSPTSVLPNEVDDRRHRWSKILVNVHLSKSERLHGGVLQDDPLSPLLFVIALEPMCQLLRQNSNCGIKTGDTVHTGSYFADDSQLYAANEHCLNRQLALVQSFCDMAGFRLNVGKKQILTIAVLSPALSPKLVTSDTPAESLGILVAPNLSPMARFNYVFDRFVSRLSLWLYKARTYAGKVAILHSICLSVLWYQLSFVPADKELAKLIDKVMLQFMHGEEINPASTTTGLRLVKKEIVCADKDSCGLDLHKSLDLWQQRAHAMQYLFQFRDSQPRCVFCGANETHQHYLFAYPFGQSVWQPFKQIQRILQCSFPRTVELLFETPKPSDKYYIRGFRKVWPIVRACVYYQIWLQRNDRTFRVDLTSKAPMEIAIHAACLVKLHIAQLLQDLPLKKDTSKCSTYSSNSVETPGSSNTSFLTLFKTKIRSSLFIRQLTKFLAC
ncbi:Aste57867_17148 [Aphanomyces stellatus]|uniref:Aste57867_17148 protein n=1 Tax=Aphanomyces stellatus TaxID=120398 RepID=A0A485L7V9_9STRA|nr:hypothetical protein As57867_017089 [Aphanomyces stellatus]VFT93905.1 Aste57867_17148 [Aphanomyces stellatus]